MVPKDYFVQRDGLSYAGTHILLDCWQAKNIDNVQHIENTLLAAAEKCGATVLHSHLHVFSPSNGVTGVVLLAESHISIHTWPERDFASIDLFMCGNCDPRLAVPQIAQAFETEAITVNEAKRGIALCDAS